MYTVAAAQWLGSFDSGMGMPSISAWAKKRRVDMDVSTKNVSQKVNEVGGNKKQLAIQKNVSTAIDKAGGDEELQEVAMDVLKKSHLQETAVDLLWQQTVVDITSTVSCVDIILADVFIQILCFLGQDHRSMLYELVPVLCVSSGLHVLCVGVWVCVCNEERIICNGNLSEVTT